MLDQVTKYLNQKEWRYTEHNDNIVFTLSGLNGVFTCVLRDFKEKKFLNFSSYMGLKCPPEKRAELAQLLTHINSNLLFGDFEMNIFEGDIKCKTGMYYEDIELNYKLIDKLIIDNVQALDICSKVFADFIFGNNKLSIAEVYDLLYPPSPELTEPKGADIIEVDPSK